MGTNSLKINICNSIEEAPNYNKDGKGFKAASLVKAIIVRNGTKDENDTVDLQFKDESGQKYICMTTGKILKMLTDLVNPDQE